MGYENGPRDFDAGERGVGGGDAVNCKACNTRIPTGAGHCPHCGHGKRDGGFIDQSPSSSGSGSAASRPSPLSPSTLAPERGRRADDIELDSEVDSEVDNEVELSLEDAMGGAKPAKRAGEANGAGKSRNKIANKASKSAKSKGSAAPPKKKTSRPVDDGERSGALGSAFVQLDAGQLRHLIAERPELLEAGLYVHEDEKGRQVGVRFETEVGEIDVLARGAEDEWVVVMIAADGAGPELVPDVLHRLGFVRKHLADSDEAVRGIVLVDQLDDDLGYAATAVSDTVAFKTWRVALTFEPLEL
jgi:hypothetical protein